MEALASAPDHETMGRGNPHKVRLRAFVALFDFRGVVGCFMGTICLTCSSQSAQPGALPSVVLVSFPAVFLTSLSGEPSRAGAGQLAPDVACPALVAVPASLASPVSSCLRLSTVSQSARATVLKHIQPPLAMARPASYLVLPWALMRALQQDAS